MTPLGGCHDTLSKQGVVTAPRRLSRHPVETGCRDSPPRPVMTAWCFRKKFANSQIFSQKMNKKTKAPPCHDTSARAPAPASPAARRLACRPPPWAAHPAGPTQILADARTRDPRTEVFPRPSKVSPPPVADDRASSRDLGHVFVGSCEGRRVFDVAWGC